MATGNMYRKFQAVWTCGFSRYASVQADKQQYRQDTLIGILHTPTKAKVIIRQAKNSTDHNLCIDEHNEHKKYLVDQLL